MIAAVTAAGAIVGVFLYIVGLAVPGIQVSFWIIPTLTVTLPLIFAASVRMDDD